MFTEKKKLLAIFLGVLGWSTVAAVPTTAEIPDHLYLTGDPSRVLWVSAEASPNGRPPIDGQLEEKRGQGSEGQGQLGAGEGASGAPRNAPCIRSEPWRAWPPVLLHIETLEDAARSAKVIVEGVVVDRKAGFFDRFEGYLLELEPGTVIQGNSASDLGLTYLVFYPQGEVRTKSACYQIEDPKFPPLPAVGDRLLMIALFHPFDEQQRILLPYEETIFVHSMSGALRIPLRWESSLKNLRFTELGQVVRHVEALHDSTDRAREP
jgi:hypothetical protein